MATINGVKTAASTATDVTAIKAVTDALVVAVTETTGTFSYDETSAAEQDAIELVISSRVSVGGIWLDLTNLTQDATIKAYHKIDGTNYRQFQEIPWLTTDQAGVSLEGFTAYRDVKVSLTRGGAGAGSVDVPYAVV